MCIKLGDPKFNCFYRATLCVISAVLAIGRCPSVCPSVTLVYYIETAKGIVELCSRPGSPIILLIGTKASLQNSNRNPLGWRR